MPKIYRSMQIEGGMPRLGESARCLGVRVPHDIAPDQSGTVVPGPQGMSVAPSLRQLPAHRIPMRLIHLAAHAAGRNDDHVWSMGEGEFVSDALCPGLALHVTSERHGVVCPDTAMKLAIYVQALATTRQIWSIDED